MMRRPITVVAALLATAAFTACDKNPVEQNGNPQLTLSWDSITLDVGASAVVTATVSSSSEPAQFVSRDQSVATVNGSGTISGVKVGTTYVVATLANQANVRDSVRVRVKSPPISIDPCPSSRPNFGVATDEDRALFAYDVNAPLNLKQTVVSTQNGVQVSDITFTSPDGGLVPGILAEPIGRPGLRPGLVLMHPGGPTAKQMAPYAEEIAQLGAVVIAIDAPYNRRGGTSFPLFTAQDRDEQIQLIKDLQRAVDVLRARADIDKGRIAFEGYSYGGIIGAQFVGIERRLKAAVLAAAMGGQVTGMTSTANLPSFVAIETCATRNTWFKAMVPVEPIRFISNASPTVLLFQMGKFDTAVMPADAEALYNAASNPKQIIRYDTGHSLNPQALIDRGNFLREQIGIDAPPTP